jgi:Fe-S-cluster-containing dehydrogenase component/DMSO reductase anchor subunit
MAEASAVVRLPLLDDRERAAEAPFTFASLERALAAQQDLTQELTAVERFAEDHDAGGHDAQAKHYRALLPARDPGPGEQYAFEVDLDACTGCKACVTACRSLNGLDEGEVFRSVGLIHGGSPEAPFAQPVTTACHHCLDPACMKGCPVGAYEKDARTGIVRHLDDQCIGCQYCTLTCPYEVPKLNRRLGIVRKCDMCSERLAVGEAPACVRGCPNEAISIRLVRRADVIEDAQAGVFLPGAPSPGITLPTTTYKTKKPSPRNALPADFYAERPAHAHTPLVALLVLTQLSVGTFCMEQLLAALAPQARSPLHALGALGLALVSLLASVLHLGRPRYAFRALIGIRTSWMSREIAAFGAYAGLASAYAGLVALESGWLAPLAPPPWIAALVPALGRAVSVVGLLAILCSVMLYHVTERRFWAAPRTTLKFLGTAAVLGASTTVFLTLASVALLSDGVLEPEVARAVRGLGVALCIASAAKLIGEACVFLHLRDAQLGDLRRTALLLSGRLGPIAFRRYAFGLLGGLALPSLFIVTAAPGPVTTALVAAALAFVFTLTGEALERTTFFTAMSAPRMPGGSP